MLHLGRFLSVAITLIMRGMWLSESAGAEVTQEPSAFEDVRIGSRFSPDPLTIRGIAGGPVSIETLAGLKETANGPCVGFTNEQPAHTLVLTSFFNYLSLQVKSPEDTTLLIRGPGGTWCNDDFDGKNPGIAGQWLPGKYSIWVGSFNSNIYPPYIINITEVQLLNPLPFRP